MVRRATPAQAAEARDALSKALYARLFGWLVRRLNLEIQTASARGGGGGGLSIGLLDMFGFEQFETNSLEQARYLVITPIASRPTASSRH